MDKNTIIAIVLSTVVIIAAVMIQPLLMGKKTANNAADVTTVENAAELDEKTAETTAELAESSDEKSLIVSEDKIEITDDEIEIAEETVTINTGVTEVVLTNKGGDIISYKLLNHDDIDTNDKVQLADNISETNKACSLAFGPADSKIIDKNFEVQKIDDYTVLFKRNITVTDTSGRQKTFALGKKYSFKENEYMFKVDVLIHGDESMGGLTFEGTAYTLRTAPQIGPHFDSKKNRYEVRQFIAYNGTKTKKIPVGTKQFKRYDKEFIWNGIASKYFEELIIPVDSTTISSGFYSSKIEKDDYANAQAIVERKSFTENDIADTYYLYYGPRNEKELKRYNIADNNAWGFSGKKLTASLQTSGWLSWLEFILKWGLELLHKVIPNYGVCIILLTIILKLLMFPLSKKQSMGTLKMQQIQPQMQAIQAKYKDNQQKQQEEMAKLYKEAGYNPASGCLPMIFTFLVLWSMYNLFNNYFEFRGQGFIPGWIPDLTVGDSVFVFKKDIPIVTSVFGGAIRILPIIYVASQLLFGKITNNGGATAGTAQNKATMKFMTYGMPLMFFFLFYNAPSGLLLYWITSNIFQMGQQLVINKIMAKKKAELSSGNGNKKPQNYKIAKKGRK
ncbi:MAG: membrane protein insertase YidC [Treponema sp.]|nr:membrane protein insertase YidC [Treponema sp.]